MPLEAGKLDRLITVEQPVTTVGTIGGEEITWAFLCRVWAEKIPQRVSERMYAAQIQASEIEVFRIRYHRGLNSKMRILFGNRIYRIVGIVETERMVSMEITAEFLEDNGGS